MTGLNAQSGSLGTCVGRPTGQHESPVAIAAVNEARFVDLQKHARVAERGPAGNLARAVTGDAGFVDTDGLGRRDHGRADSKRRTRVQFALSIRPRHVLG